MARDVRRNLPKDSKKLVTELYLAERLLKQEKKSKYKLYSLQEPFVDCISKGKAHKRYEFGCKASLATTNTSKWIVAALAHHGNPFDGHTLKTVLIGVEKITGVRPADAYVDKSYKGSQKDSPDVRSHISRTKRGKSKRQKKLSQIRSKIYAIIGYIKADNRLGRNFLKGINGDHFNVILAAAGRDFSKLVGLIFLFRLFEAFFFAS